ncbi:hypothetical protein FRC17_002057 [Serendipita sp. 399]|nr:hypothetical protein FRC17_002057 [Serendipita sp. 399]
MWGRARPIVATTRTPPPPVRVESESSPTQVYQRPLSEIVEDSGPDLDLLKLLQERRRQRRGGDGTYIPGANEPVEEILEIPPRPDSAPIDYGLQDEPITKTWYQDRPSRARPENLMADPMHDGASESPTPRRTPILIPREPPSSRPTIPLGELPSTASYAEMLALLRQNELMQRHQTEQQNELVRYLHDLNGWLARDVNNRQLELQGVEDRITHLQNALGNRVPPPYPVTYVAEQEPVIPLQSHAPQRFGDPDDFVIPPSRMGRLPPPMAYGQPPLGAFAPYPRTMFGEPASPPIIPTAPSMMPIIEVRGMAPPSRSRPTFKSPSPDQGRSRRAESAHVLDPTRRGSPQLPPPSAQPNIINVNIPPSHMHGTSHSPSRRRREGSRSPSPQIIHTTSHRRTQSPPTIIHDDRMSRRARSHRDGEPVIVMGEGSRRGERRSESGSRSPSPIILTGPSGSSRPRSSRRRRPQMVVSARGVIAVEAGVGVGRQARSLLQGHHPVQGDLGLNVGQSLFKSQVGPAALIVEVLNEQYMYQLLPGVRDPLASSWNHASALDPDPVPGKETD